MRYTNESKGRQKVYINEGTYKFLEPGESVETETDEPRVLEVAPEPKPEPEPKRGAEKSESP